MSIRRILYNFTAITFGAGIIRSCYRSEDGQVFLIHTDLRDKDPTIRVCLSRDW